MCDDRGLHLHLDIAVAGGSNARWVVEYAVDRRRRRNISKTGDVGALVFLDADRLDEDRAAGRDPQTVPGREHLKLVFLRPKLEGLLIRLHGGWERRFVAAQDAERQLKRLWPQYRKPMPAHALRERFGLDDLRRAAAHDRGLRDALTMLGLIP
ncbi:MAG: hypothetical protein OXQ84_11750 [bacterium]|nr:hypothetical protein [bacterium]